LYQDELFLYRENSFIPDIQTAHLELLQRRPDLFSVSGARLNGTLPVGDEGWSELGRRASWMAPRINHQVLTPFLNRINNGIEGKHSAQPALSLVANRPFEQWTDMDVERFPGLADGIGDLFQQAWQNYGDSGPDLTAKELQQKERLRKKIKPHISIR
jgi:hypothetical protein